MGDAIVVQDSYGLMKIKNVLKSKLIVLNQEVVSVGVVKNNIIYLQISSFKHYNFYFF